MIQIIVNSEMFSYDMYHISKAFYPNESYEQVFDETSEYAVCIKGNSDAQEEFLVHQSELENIEERKLKKRYVNLKLYDWLTAGAGKELAWGILTGVRPTKLMMSLIESGMTEDEVNTLFQLLDKLKENLRKGC